MQSDTVILCDNYVIQYSSYSFLMSQTPRPCPFLPLNGAKGMINTTKSGGAIAAEV